MTFFYQPFSGPFSNTSKRRRPGLGGSYSGLGLALTRGLKTASNLKAPSAPSVPYTPAASQASSAPGLNPAQPYDYTADPTYMNDLTAISQHYGYENERINQASGQDKIALNRAYSIMGASPADPNTGLGGGTFQPGVYDTAGNRMTGTIYSDRQSAASSANKAGLFYSGQLGQNLGDINLSYTNKVGELQSNFKGAEDLRDIQRRELTSTYGPGGTMETQAKNTAKEKADAIAAQQALIDAINASNAPAASTAAGATASTYAGNNALSPFTRGYLSGPRGEPLFTKNGRYYYKRASDGQVIPWSG